MALGVNKKQIGINYTSTSILIYYIETLWRLTETGSQNHERDFEEEGGTEINKIPWRLILQGSGGIQRGEEEEGTETCWE